VTADKPNPPDPKKVQPVEGKEIEEFFQQLPANFRWPKPNAEAVAAAVEAIHREERGKYLVVLVRRPAGTWKILADCWSADLAVSVPPPETAARKGSEPIPPLRKPR
jgi:hypothetical protein